MPYACQSAGNESGHRDRDRPVTTVRNRFEDRVGRDHGPGSRTANRCPRRRRDGRTGSRLRQIGPGDSPSRSTRRTRTSVPPITRTNVAAADPTRRASSAPASRRQSACADQPTRTSATIDGRRHLMHGAARPWPATVTPHPPTRGSWCRARRGSALSMPDGSSRSGPAPVLMLVANSSSGIASPSAV